MANENNDLNAWTHFELVMFNGKNYGYIRKRDNLQTLYFNDSGELMVNLQAEKTCTPGEMAELNRIALMVLGGEDPIERFINPFGQIPRRLQAMNLHD